MRRSIALLVIVSACAGSDAPAPPTARSMRERLAEPARLLLVTPRSGGAITARHYTSEGWQGGATPIAIADGELDVTADADGQLAVATLAISAQPIDIPASVFGSPAQLQGLRLTLRGEPVVATSWSDDDHATASAALDLDLQWEIATGASVLPLPALHLHGVAVAVQIAGTSQVIDAAIAVRAGGELWSLADLLSLADLTLTLAASDVTGGEP
jgi:hypothetical protein